MLSGSGMSAGDREAGSIEVCRARSSEGRQPSFAFSKLYSPFVSWMDIVAKWAKVKGIQRLEKEFCQQDLGEAYEESGRVARP